MPLTKSKGHMYPWVTHTHAHLGGECPHRCSYCYVDSPRFGRPAKYVGPLRLIEAEFAVKYGAARTIFVENCNDLFADAVPWEFILRVMAHCREWPENTYVFQTKNPMRMGLAAAGGHIPLGSLLGCTIETNRDMSAIGSAPPAIERARAMEVLSTHLGWRTFITVEPILDFDLERLYVVLCDARPSFVNIGADSKNHGLPEPSVENVMGLVDRLRAAGIEIREKHNLHRLVQS
jgi:DNA repair photolyase